MMKRLEYLRGISDDECERLRRIGVRHTNQLIHVTTLVGDRGRVERRTGIPVDRLYALGQQASLMEISGLARHLHLIVRLGITSLRELGTSDPFQLHRRISLAAGPAAAPSLQEVQYWVSQARYIDVVEDQEDTTANRVNRWVSR
ncbi:MAG: DUF4332 domain-containing protein [Candidatus Dormibacteraeota bacterium]|nr:DUF4332 domain-containing protein [Candidatus Dormibacteraeota bacterium]